MIVPHPLHREDRREAAEEAVEEEDEELHGEAEGEKEQKSRRASIVARRATGRKNVGLSTGNQGAEKDAGRRR